MDDRNSNPNTGYGMQVVEKYVSSQLYEGQRFSNSISHASNRAVVADIFCKNTTS
jgi:hypothetical protein